MTVHSLVQVLEDSATVVEIAKHAGITEAQARKVLAALDDLPGQQVVRICATARAEQIRQINRETRKESGR